MTRFAVDPTTTHFGGDLGMTSCKAVRAMTSFKAALVPIYSGFQRDATEFLTSNSIKAIASASEITLISTFNNKGQISYSQILITTLRLSLKIP